MTQAEIKEHAKNIGITDEKELEQVVKAYKTNNYGLVEEYITKKKWNEFKEKVKTKMKIYCRFNPSATVHPSNMKENTIEAIIMGPCGNGKTCLINHICGSNLPNGSSDSSLTRDVTQLPSQFLFQPQLIVYDTPGTSAIQDKLQHAVLLRGILTWRPVNTVFVLVKYNNRFDELIKAIYHQVYLLKGYESSIVFLVTHFDLEKEPQQAIQRINKMLEEKRIDNNIVYFSNNSCDERALVETLYFAAASHPKVKIQIEDNHFFKNFNLTPEKGEEIFFEAEVKDALRDMEEVTQIYGDFATTLPNNEERQSIYQDLQVILRNELLEILEVFKDKFKNTMVQCSFYTSYYTLQTKILDFMAQFQRKIRGNQTYKHIESQATGNKTDIRDLIKRCPNSSCGLVWFRIQACPNTTCGNRPTCFFDFMKNTFFNFFIKRTGKKITVQKKGNDNNLKKNANQQEKFKQVRQKENNEKKNSGQQINFNPRGCQQSMNFETLPRLPNIEEILTEWYAVDTIQEVIDRFQKEKELQEVRLKMERKAREMFGSFRH